MKPDTKKLLKQAGWATTIGFQVAFSIFIGLAIGVYLDSTWGTFPYLTLVFIVLGIVAGYRNLLRFTRKTMREDREEQEARYKD